MFTLVIGGSASGKSDYAERHVLSLDGSGPRIYIATMEPFGDEARFRIARHHAMRKDRGFETIECYRNPGSLELPPDSNVLLEDLGNLMANELFGRGSVPEGDKKNLPDRMAAALEKLLSGCAHLTIVTNEIFSGGKEYAGETLAYMRALAKLNRILARRADLVVEVVCGQPNILKGNVPKRMPQ